MTESPGSPVAGIFSAPINEAIIGKTKDDKAQEEEEKKHDSGGTICHCGHLLHNLSVLCKWQTLVVVVVRVLPIYKEFCVCRIEGEVCQTGP